MKHSPFPWNVSEFDGVTIGSGHIGVAATSPDPVCKHHYRGGVPGGNFFAPVEDVEVQKGNAVLIAQVGELLHCLRDAHAALRHHPGGDSRDDRDIDRTTHVLQELKWVVC